MNMERQFRAGNLAQKRTNALANAKDRLLEDSRIDSAIVLEEHFESRSKAISRMADQFGTSRQGSRKKILAEKFRFRNTLRDKLFLESVYDIFMEALVLDQGFKEKYAGNFYKLTEDMVGELFASGQLSYKSISENGSQVIQTVLQLCEATADKEATDKFDMDKANTKKGAILNEKDKEVKMSKEAKGDFDDKKTMETKSIANAVADKVVTVIRDEQDQADEDQKLQEEIEEKTLPKEDEQDAGVTEDAVDTEDDNMDDAGSVAESMKMIRIPNKVTQHSLFKSLQINIANKNLSEMKQLSESTGEAVNLDMDLVFAESIAYYTLLETLYTTRLIDLKATEMRKFAKELIYKK